MTAYLPRHDTQYEPRTIASSHDCNMAAAADALRFFTLGMRDRNHDQMRHDSGTYGELADGNQRNDGTNISDAQHALSVNGCPSTVFDELDRQLPEDVWDVLRAGGVVIAHGDYGSVPAALRGPISRTYTGLHAVLFHSLTSNGVLVGDGLSEVWTTWPLSVAAAYMTDFPGMGCTFLSVMPQLVTSRVTLANVRAQPSTLAGIRGTIGPRVKLHAGGTVIGRPVGANKTWWRVWFKGSAGYVHSSVAKLTA